MSKKKLKAKLVSALIVLILMQNSSPVFANTEEAPKGINQALWTNFRNMLMFDVEGEKRNLKWISSPGYFVKGSPTEQDISTLNNTLAIISSNCSNIKPGRISLEPNEGVIFNFVPKNQFKEYIPAIPDNVDNSWLYWTYYKNRGITKTQVVVANELKDQLSRNYLIRVRVLQAFGFYNLSDDKQYSFLSNNNNWEYDNALTNPDIEILKFYCSRLIRAWDTESQTKTYIDGNSTTGPTNQFPSFSNKLKIVATNYGAALTIYPEGDLIWENKVDSILVQVQTKQGVMVFSNSINVSQDYFSAQELFINNLESNKYYDIFLYNKNLAGYGSPQKISFQTGNITTTSIPSSSKTNGPQDSTNEIKDASSAVNDSYKALIEAVAGCNAALESNNPQILGALKEMSLIGSCTPILNKGKRVLDATNSIVKINMNSSQTEINKSIDAWNAATDEMNMLCEEADAKTAEIQDALDSINLVLEQVENVSFFSSFIKIEAKKLNNQLSLLPTKKKNLITNLDEFIQLKKDISLLSSVQTIILNYQLNRLNFKSTSESLAKFDEIPDINQLKINFEIVQDNLPKYSCVKGKLVVDFIVKCPTGYLKKSIK